MLITQQLTTTASQNAMKPALRYLGKETNYTELKTVVSRLSYLYQHEIGSENRVAFLARNSPALITTFFAMANTRSVSIFLDPTKPPEETIRVIKDVKPTHLAVTSDLLPAARDILQAAHLNLPIIEIEKKHGGEYDTSYTPPPDNTPKDTDVVLLVRTNSGKPRYAKFTHKQLHSAATCLKSTYHLTGVDRVLTQMSWAHAFPFVHGMLFPLMSGACCVIDHGLDALQFIEFMIDSRVSRLVATPPLCLKLLMTCRNEKKMIPGLKSITVGIGCLSTELKKAFSLLKISVSQCYGQVENLWTICMEDTQHEGETDRFCVGKGLPGFKYKVMDDNLDPIETSDARTGYLAVASPCIMSGYLDQEKESKNVMRGTWLYTGDIVTARGEGDDLQITYVGRKEDVIKAGDSYQSIAQVDAVLRKIQGIQDAACFTAKNSRGHTVLVAVCVKQAGVVTNEKIVMDYCTANLSIEFCPKAAVFTDTIPRDQGNNVICSKLRAQFSQLAG